MSIIGNISTRKAVSPNSIPNLILKEFKDKLKTIIIKPYNHNRKHFFINKKISKTI